MTSAEELAANDHMSSTSNDNVSAKALRKVFLLDKNKNNSRKKLCDGIEIMPNSSEQNYVGREIKEKEDEFYCQF